MEGNEVIELLYDWILGCYMMKIVFDFEMYDEIVGNNVLIDEDLVYKIVDVGVMEVMICFVFICNIKYGVCEYCYGCNMVIGDEVEVGEVVGIVVVQFIGEFGIQLIMWNFYIGGVVGDDII